MSLYILKRQRSFMKSSDRLSAQSGFSLMELMIAMAVTLVVMVVASTLLAGSLNTRKRENQRTEALADVQRALNTLSREISNSGFGLNSNGIVAADSNGQSIRIRSNLNAFTGGTGVNAVSEQDEDVYFSLYANGSNIMVTRFDVNTSTTTVLANRIDNFNIHYYDERVTYTTSGCDITSPLNSAGAAEAEVPPSDAKYIVIAACVRLPAIGTKGATGYQPAMNELLVTDITLRNAIASSY